MSLQIIPAKRDAVVFQFEYTNDERMEYFKQQIDENIGPQDYKTNVKGKMTEYDFFLRDSIFKDFINKEFFMVEIYKYQRVFPLLGKLDLHLHIPDAWGSKLEKTNEVVPHKHSCNQWSSILYFCNSAPLETEIGTFETSKGKVITIPGWIKHWVKPVNKERYNVVWNWDYYLKHKREEKYLGGLSAE